MGGNRPAALNRRAGSAYERLALDYLERHGLLLVERNFSCRFGEIDLLMRDGRTLVVVEVRYRANSAYGGAADSVTPAKQQKIARTANCYLGRHPHLAALPLRFDVVAFDHDRLDANTPEDGCGLQWLQDAFRPGSPY